MAAEHRGGTFVEIYQNCNVYNDGAFDYFAERSIRPEMTVNIEHGKPLLFGENNEKGIKLDGLTPIICDSSDPDILVHNEKSASIALPYLLSDMSAPELPVALGVLRSLDLPTYEDRLSEQIREAKSQFGEGDIDKLLHSGDNWTISK